MENRLIRSTKRYFQEIGLTPFMISGHIWVSCLWLCLLMACCTPSEPRRLATVRPNTDNLLGNWKLRNIDDFREFQFEDINVFLKSDYSFEASLPDSFFDPLGRSERRTKSVQGRWRIEEDSQGYWGVVLVIDGHGAFSMSIESNNPPYYLSRNIGDADKNEIISFIQKK